jgi:WD40 repeat protein
MPAPNLCAFDASGRVIVISDGRQVLVHGGSDEAPLWKRDLDADLVGLAAAGDAVATLESSGKVSFWAIDGGAPLGVVTVLGSPTALSAARERARFAAVLPGGVAVVERGGEPRIIALEGASAAAFTDDGARLAVGAASGEVKIVTAAGDPVGTSRLDGAVTSLCWSSAGMWIVTTGDRVLRLAPEGGPPEPITRAGGMAPDCVSASGDGTMLAVRLTPEIVMALAYPSKETVVQLRYIERTVSGVAFGPGRLLGVGLVGGDGNIVDIPAEQLRRTDTFPGRTHNRWLVSTMIKPGLLPPATGKPIGAAKGTAVAGPRAGTALPAKPRSTSAVWLGIAALLVVVAVVLSRCG